MCDDQASFRPQHGPGVLRAPVAKNKKKGSSDKTAVSLFGQRANVSILLRMVVSLAAHSHSLVGKTNNVRATASPLNSCCDFRERRSLASGAPNNNNYSAANALCRQRRLAIGARTVVLDDKRAIKRWQTTTNCPKLRNTSFML